MRALEGSTHALSGESKGVTPRLGLPRPLDLDLDLDLSLSVLQIMRQRVTLPSLVIASSGTESGELDLRVAGRENLAGVAIYAPAALTGTVTVEWSPDGTTWNTLQEGGSDVAVGAGDVVVVDFSLALAKVMRLLSSGAEGAERTFQLIGYEAFA